MKKVSVLLMVSMVFFMVFTSCSTVNSLISESFQGKGLEEIISSISDDWECDFIWEYVSDSGKVYYFVGDFVEDESKINRYIVCKNGGTSTFVHCSAMAEEKGYKVMSGIAETLTYRTRNWTSYKIGEK